MVLVRAIIFMREVLVFLLSGGERRQLQEKKLPLIYLCTLVTQDMPGKSISDESLEEMSTCHFRS